MDGTLSALSLSDQIKFWLIVRITVYNTSDTNVFSDMQLSGQMYDPKIAIMAVGVSLQWELVRPLAQPVSFVQILLSHAIMDQRLDNCRY